MMTTEPDNPSLPNPARGDRADLLGLDPVGFSRRVGAAMEARGEPAYRTEQLRGWVFDHKARSFDECTTLPKRLRADLGSELSLTPLERSTP